MARVFIALDNIDGVIKQFDVEEVKDAENIREKLKQDETPHFVYEDGDIEKRKEIGKDDLIPGCIYVWLTKKNLWENRMIVQNALFNAEAVYKSNPFTTLQLSKEFHTVSELIGVGRYYNGIKEHRALFSLAEDPWTKQKMLVISFQGSDVPQEWKDNIDLFSLPPDWQDNLNFSLEPNLKYSGKFHAGFKERANLVSIDDIRRLAELYRVHLILTCGHSLGGAVSSIIHMDLIRSAKYPFPVKKKDIINITFGSPYFGNDGLRKHAKDKEYSRNMFHFASVLDVIPSLLSLGHSVKSIQNQLINQASNLTGGVSEVFRQFTHKNKKQMDAIAAISSNILDVYFNHTEDGRKSRFKELFAAVSKLNQNIEGSSLQNEYTDKSYVPIGKYVILSPGRDAELLDHSSKIVERILQAAVEEASNDFNIRDIVFGHRLESYIHVIKEKFGGFQEFPNNNIQRQRKPLDTCFQEHFQFEYPCAYSNCDQTQTNPIDQQTAVVICRTCQADEHTKDYIFHTECSYYFHKLKQDHHIQSCSVNPAGRFNSEEYTRKSQCLQPRNRSRTWTTVSQEDILNKISKESQAKITPVVVVDNDISQREQTNEKNENIEDKDVSNIGHISRGENFLRPHTGAGIQARSMSEGRTNKENVKPLSAPENYLQRSISNPVLFSKEVILKGLGKFKEQVLSNQNNVKETTHPSSQFFVGSDMKAQTGDHTFQRSNCIKKSYQPKPSTSMEEESDKEEQDECKSIVHNTFENENDINKSDIKIRERSRSNCTRRRYKSKTSVSVSLEEKSNKEGHDEYKHFGLNETENNITNDDIGEFDIKMRDVDEISLINSNFQRKKQPLKLKPSLSLEDDFGFTSFSLEERLQALVCPLCSECGQPMELQSIIFTCPTGHEVCSKCKRKMENCSSCNQPLTEQLLEHI